MPLFFHWFLQKIMIWFSTTIYFTVIGWLCRYIHDRHFLGLYMESLGALDALLNIFKAQNVETIYFLGDSIGYIPDARVVRRLRQVEHKCYCIRGNRRIPFKLHNLPKK